MEHKTTQESPKPMQDSPLLMIVDDSRMSRMLIKAVIAAQRPHWRLVEASSGDEAVLKAQECCPDYITMDLNMPGINGLEAAAQILHAQPGTRIALCTANIQERMREAAQKAGVFFVGKPITEATLQPAIQYFEE